MFDIRKKIIAVAVICALSLSMAACSDKKNGSNTAGIKTATISSEEAKQLMKHDLEISEYIEATDTAQDPVESEGSSNGNSNNDSVNSSESSGEDETFNAEELMSGTDVIFVPGGDDDSSNSSNGNINVDSNSNSSKDDSKIENQNGNDSKNESNQNEIKGKKKIQQAYWMNLSKDFVFDGEFITATFKIKDTTANGTYPITIDWLDFSNIKAVTVPATGINGSVVVGGDAVANSFKNDGSFEVMAENVSGNAGDTVTVVFKFNKNPGICASVFRFGYDSDALEYVKGGYGTDFKNSLRDE